MSQQINSSVDEIVWDVPGPSTPNVPSAPALSTRQLIERACAVLEAEELPTPTPIVPVPIMSEEEMNAASFFYEQLDRYSLPVKMFLKYYFAAHTYDQHPLCHTCVTSLFLSFKIWDISEMICIRNFFAAHSAAIYGLSTRPYSKSFATGSLDQTVCLWDQNVQRPALDLLENDCGIRCVQWLDENRLLFGDDAGMVRVVDVRFPDLVMKVMEFPAAVHRLAYNSESNNVAICCDNKVVSVYHTNDECTVEEKYNDKLSHSNFVRGLAWDNSDKQLLHTVGWDDEFKSHKIE